MQPSDEKGDHPSLNLSEFWREHDRSLSHHERFGNVTLSHDLYRGMPPWFNAYFAYFQRRVVRHLISKCKMPSGTRALDVGCGTGRWCEFMLSQNWKAYGIDIGTQALLHAARTWPEICFTWSMLPALCFADESFDLAMSVTVLQHIPYEQQQGSLDAIYRTLKSGGYLVACESIDMSDPSPHIFGNTLDNWSNRFRNAGFRIVSIAGSEYLPHVRVFHWLYSKQKASHASIGHSDVGAIVQNLTKHPILVVLIWLGIAFSYPLEYVGSIIFPVRWARLGCFILKKT